MSEWQEVKSSIISWGKVGDYIEGTLTDIRDRDVNVPGKGVVRKKLYEVKADEGQYHEVDDKKNPVEPPVKCGKDDYYTIWGGKENVDNGMRKAKLGQKVKIMFAEEIPSKQKGYSAFKLIKVYVGAMDEEWAGQEINVNDLKL